MYLNLKLNFMVSPVNLKGRYVKFELEGVELVELVEIVFDARYTV